MYPTSINEQIAMNSEQKSRIANADAKVERSKDLLKTTSANLNHEIDRFGTYRRTVLKQTIGRFKTDLNIIGKKIKGCTYHIPYEVEFSKLEEITMNEVNFTSDQKWQIGASVTKATLIATNKMLEVISKRKGFDFKPYTNPSNPGAQGWLGLVIALCEIGSAIAEKKHKKRPPYKNTKQKLISYAKKIDERVEFCLQIIKRIKEIVSVSDELQVRCEEALAKLETIINSFDVENQMHLGYLQTTLILLKGISELSKVEILDSNNQLSLSDQQYIIKSKQLLTESL